MQAVNVIVSSDGVPAIELATSQGNIDLHNFADFERFEYSTEGIVKFSWVPTVKGELLLGSRAISKAVLLCEQVRSFSVTSRDPEMPLSEDKTLDDLELAQLQESNIQLKLNFCGGIKINLLTQKIELLVDYDR